MSKLSPTDFDNVVVLIESIFKTANVPGVIRNQYGYPCADIILSVRLAYPTNTMTDQQICVLLARGARSGVFKTICAGASDPEISTCGSGVALYSVNTNMVKVNPMNQIYSTYFNGPPTVPPTGVYNPLYDSIPAINYAAFITSGFSSGTNAC